MKRKTKVKWIVISCFIVFIFFYHGYKVQNIFDELYYNEVRAFGIFPFGSRSLTSLDYVIGTPDLTNVPS